jgi:hypothetical protein
MRSTPSSRAAFRSSFAWDVGTKIDSSTNQSSGPVGEGRGFPRRLATVYAGLSQSLDPARGHPEAADYIPLLLGKLADGADSGGLGATGEFLDGRNPNCSTLGSATSRQSDRETSILLTPALDRPWPHRHLSTSVVATRLRGLKK